MNYARTFTLAALLIAVFTAAAPAQENQSLSLQESIDIGLKNSKILHASQMRSQSAVAHASGVSTSMYPSLKLGGAYSHLSDVPPFVAAIPPGAFGGGLPQQELSFQLSPTILDNYNLRLTAVQPLFTGFRLSSSSDIAQNSALAATADADRARAELIYSITSAYWSLYKANDFKRVSDETIDQVNAHLTDVRNLMAQGMATTNDVLRVEVQLSNVRLQQIDAENNVRLSTISLNTLMGQNIATRVQLLSRPDSTAADSSKVTVDEYNDLVQRALNNRPEYKSMQYRVAASDAGVTLAKSSWFPQLYLTGNYYYANPNQRYVPAQAQFNDSWDVNVTASIDIWNWGQTVDQTNEAQAELQLSKDLMGQVKDNISLEVAQSLFNVNQAKEKIKVADEAVKQSQENHRITNEKYKMGLMLNSDVVDAQLTLFLARTTYTQALVDYEVALAKLQQSIGEELHK
jgi:outer membrane protein TolC